MNQKTEKQNVAQDMLTIAGFKDFKKVNLHTIAMLKQAGYNKKEARLYMHGLASVTNIIVFQPLIAYWIKKMWRRL